MLRVRILLATVLMLLATGVAVLWGVSYFSPVTQPFSLANQSIMVQVQTGEAEIRFFDRGSIFFLFPYPNAHPFFSLANSCTHHFAGFGLSWDSSYSFPDHRVVAPLWFPMLLCTIPGVVLLLKIRKQIVPNANDCVRCGYDLRASVERCPECDNPIPPVQRHF